MASNDALIGRALAGRYRLQQRRGAGAHGIVLDAIDEQLQRPVAVKIMLPQFVGNQTLEARFRLEAQVAGSLNHPNLNAVYDWGVEEVEGATVPYLVLEHLSGGSLRDVLDRGRLLTPSQALMVGLDACRGLDYMHKRGVIHRDLKPANLAFGDDRHLRILDVGVSRMVAEQTWSEPTAAGLDAARYASPEQARGGSPHDGTLDSATDIYSLCLLMIESVTGHVPFSSDSTVATLNARLDKLMPVSAEFGPLASVLSRAGSVAPSDRYSAAQFGQALVQAAENLPRPGLLPIVLANGFGEGGASMRRPDDPTGPINRPEPTVSQAIVPADPPPDPPAPPSDSPLDPPSDPPSDSPSGSTPDLLPDLLPGGSGELMGSEADPPSPATEPVEVLMTAPPQLNIVMANADPDGTPHVEPPPTSSPPTSTLPPSTTPPSSTPSIRVVPPPPPDPSAFALVPSDAVSDELAISLATERPRSESVGATTAATADAGRSTLHIADRVLAHDTAEPRLYDQIEDEGSAPPPRRRRGWLFALVLLVVAAVAGAFVATRLLEEKSATVPDLVGRPASEAMNEISSNDWSVVVRTERNDEQPLGNVIRTDPPAGIALLEGSAIIFVVSDGPTLSVLPDVTGQTLEAATATLADVNLDIIVGDEDFCESVPVGDGVECPDLPAGSVISWMVPEQPLIPAGTEVMQRTVVAVTLSKGPAPRRVPELKGLDEPTATQTMTDLGLLLVRDADIFSDEFAAGIVADQSLPEGTVLQRGETVVYALSKGPDVVAMPAIDGQSYDQLFAAINASGLTVGAVTGPTDGTGTLTVTAGGQPVVAGQLLRRGTAIDLSYAAPDPPPATTAAPAG